MVSPKISFGSHILDMSQCHRDNWLPPVSFLIQVRWLSFFGHVHVHIPDRITTEQLMHQFDTKQLEDTHVSPG